MAVLSRTGLICVWGTGPWRFISMFLTEVYGGLTREELNEIVCGTGPWKSFRSDDKHLLLLRSWVRVVVW